MEKPEGNERLAAFTDGVLAISMTLLALDIRLPVDAADLSDGALWQALLALQPRLYAYALSFLVVATFWIGHKAAFRHISRSNPVIDRLNVIFLLLAGLVPFVTQLLADNNGAVAAAVYSGVMALTSAALGSVAVYARHAGLSEPEEKHGSFLWPDVQHYGVALVFLLSIPVTFWNPDYGKYFWLLLIPLNIGRLRRRTVKRTGS